MGARTNIVLEYGDGKQICFYSHWGGSGLPEVLKAALIRGKSRWNDPYYLARIIFCEMIQDDVLGLTGFGIQPDVDEEEYETLYVDLRERKVNGISYADYIL